MMRLRLLLPAAVVALCAAAPAAQAALPTPVWLTPQAVAPSGDASSGYGVIGAATPTGGAFVGWNIVESGHNRMRVTYRPPGGDWTAPVTLGPTGHGAYWQDWTAEPDGTITIAYYVDGLNRVYTQSINGDTGAVGDPELFSDPDRGSGCGSFATAEDGTTYFAWCSDETYLRVRAPGSSTWSAPEPVTEQSTSGSKVAITGDGDLVVLYRLASPSRLRAIVRPAGSSDWSAPVTLATSGNDLSTPRVAVGTDGRLTALWIDSNGGGSPGQAYTATYDGTAWSASTAFGGPATIVGEIVPDRDGNILAGWLGIEGTYVSRSATLAPGATTFTPGTVLNPDGELAGITGLAVRPDGSAFASLLHGTDLMSISFGVIGRTGNDTWSGPTDMPAGSYSPADMSFITADPEGNLLTGWETADGTPTVVAADGAGPQLSDLTVPSTAAAGETAAMSVSAADTWSDVETISWNFGDGASATGAVVSHAYGSGGTFTVTVTATDTVGHATTATRTITVAEPPADDTGDDTGKTPKPPVVIAPVIEARLAGKTVTVNARVTLKAGQKCKGTITVTTAFGGKTYKAPAKLALKNGACRATAQITLKKTPSLRTKLRVTVGATKTDKKKITTRTITSRRG